jgi:hypothetical protein
VLALQPRQLGERGAQLLLQPLQGAAQALLLVRGELVQLLGAEDLSVARGREGHPHRPPDHRDAGLRGLAVHVRERLLLAHLEIGLQRLLLPPVLVALERGGQ